MVATSPSRLNVPAPSSSLNCDSPPAPNSFDSCLLSCVSDLVSPPTMASSPELPTNAPPETSDFEQSNLAPSHVEESNTDAATAALDSNGYAAEPAEVTPRHSPPAPVRKRKPFILLPLYIWPGTGVWDPLFAAAEANPDLDLWVIVNPFNGPGLGALPDANYLEELSRLTAVPNAKVIGYVRCDYGRRPIEEILAEIDKYACWGKELVKQGDERTILVDGIFIDETPPDTEYVEYLTTLSNAAKTTLDRSILKPAADGDDPRDDAAAPPPPTESEEAPAPPSRAEPSVPVIYNPGVVVDSAFYLAADYIVTYENAVDSWNDKWVRHNFERLFAPLKARSIIIAHSAEGGYEGVKEISEKAFEEGFMGQYITSAPGYEAWCPCWDKYCADVARRGAEYN